MVGSLGPGYPTAGVLVSAGSGLTGGVAGGIDHNCVWSVPKGRIAGPGDTKAGVLCARVCWVGLNGRRRRWHRPQLRVERTQGPNRWARRHQGWRAVCPRGLMVGSVWR